MWARRGRLWRWGYHICRGGRPFPPQKLGCEAGLAKWAGVGCGCVEGVLGHSSTVTVLPQAELNTSWFIKLLKDALINDR